MATSAVLGYLVLCVSVFVQAGRPTEDDFSSRMKREKSVSSEISYECLTTNKIPGSCVHYSQCPEHSTKSVEQLLPHRCAIYRKEEQPPIVCCAGPQTRPPTARVPASVRLLQTASDDERRPKPFSGRVLRLQPVRNAVSLSQPAKDDRFTPQPESDEVTTPQPDSDEVTMPQPDSDELLDHPNARLLPTGSCGRHANASMSTGRSSGKNSTQLGEFPWTVLLKYRIGNRHKFLCGGILIGDRYALTAAHCVVIDAAQLVAVRIGEYDHTTNPDCRNPEEATERNCAPPVRDISVSKILSPMEYDKSNRNHYYDIAVLILKNPILFNDYVQPICLPFGEIGRRDLTNRRLWTAGWGTRKGRESEEKKQADIRVWNHLDCATEYQGGRIAISRDQQICVGESGRDSCKSDSGGPLMGFRGTPRGDIWYLYGIASFGPTPCDAPGIPEVYTRVSYYLKWIMTTLSTV